MGAKRRGGDAGALIDKARQVLETSLGAAEPEEPVHIRVREVERVIDHLHEAKSRLSTLQMQALSATEDARQADRTVKTRDVRIKRLLSDLAIAAAKLGEADRLSDEKDRRISLLLDELVEVRAANDQLRTEAAAQKRQLQTRGRAVESERAKRLEANVRLKQSQELATSAERRAQEAAEEVALLRKRAGERERLAIGALVLTALALVWSASVRLGWHGFDHAIEITAAAATLIGFAIALGQWLKSRSNGG